MSIAGIRSNRGDGYQTLVAFEWALGVLADPDFQWIEIDSVTHLVDDIVVGKTDGTQICCQCKKNQTNFREWSISDLADELAKAFSLLVSNEKAEARFYSRSPFSALAKLREHSTSQANEANYLESLGKEHLRINGKLAELITNSEPSLSTYEFLRRTVFETSPELDRMEYQLRERLRFMACNPNTAYDALWTRLDQLGSRIVGENTSASTQHRLNKGDLVEVLHQAGAMLAPTMLLAELRTSFANTSAIGRSWRQDIAGQYIIRPVLNELLTAIDAGNRAILLTGLPGSGKTCVMLALQEALEDSMRTCNDRVPLFIQSREFADLSTAKDREAQGLPEQWVEKAARVAETAHVVVVIDSLDVLSIAREHNVLTYFLAQIDRLLLLPNITVVTACRDFDRRYDRRISERQWDFEGKCLPLNWEIEITPLLDTFGIQTANIDAVTRELILNPRELALFVELAQREGSFNVVTSQALAQKYLDTVVRADVLLGESAIQAIEGIANEMLKLRRLSVPHQRFTASPVIKRLLCSLNVLQETQGGELTFGHQTLLDVLVISRAVRMGVTLNKFIQDLPPVPFVRPSIRSFIGQLVTGDRREFRKQLRTVLTGSAAFHIRRLVAESLAELKPQKEDWPLIRDLRVKHRDVFQVIYTHANQIEWHHFWFTHLVPIMQEEQDAEGLIAHIHLVSRWINEDTEQIVIFWMETFQLDWLDKKSNVCQLVLHLLKIDTENLVLVLPLLEQILSHPRQDDHLLGHVVARCVSAGTMNDIWLWRYIAGDISDDDVVVFEFDDKLHCQPYEFGDKHDHFFLQRIENSTTLLNLALESIERWSQIKSSDWEDNSLGYVSHFLGKTSYVNNHGKNDLQNIDSENILLLAVETAIIHHAKKNSVWWKNNCERLCSSSEGAMRYFAILACTTSPKGNIDLIGRILCDKAFIKFDLSYEIAMLMKVAFIYLDTTMQGLVMECILSTWEGKNTNDENRNYFLNKKAKLISTIPCYLRSLEVQEVVDIYKKSEGVLTCHPEIMSRGGTVSAPFSFKVFLDTSDSGILCLLAHYAGYKRNWDDFLIGGEEQVRGQLCEASSRNPERFLRLLSNNFTDIVEVFRNAIIDGISNYLERSYGNTQTNDSWEAVEKPDGSTLAVHVLNELERHQHYWQLHREAAKVLKACASVVVDTQNAARLVFLTIGFARLREESSFNGDSVSLITMGINMVSGHVTEALMILTNKLQELNVPFPELLLPTLRCFAQNENPAIRALVLRRLPWLQSQNPELGWELFQLSIKDSTGLWHIAEPCFYYAYHNHFEKVEPLLARILCEGSGKDLETWSRISALAALNKYIDFSVFLNDLKTLNNTQAWLGAACVWTNHENIKRYREQCLKGISEGVSDNNPHAATVALEMTKLFNDNKVLISIPIKLIQFYFKVMEMSGEKKRNNFFGFNKWLNGIASRDPALALTATEVYLGYVSRTKLYLYDHRNSFTQLITRLFAEAEEVEESDHGAMLQRVVSVQDTLLTLGVDGVNDWLKAAERP